jgi:Ca-activated chloride channel family protein
MMRLAVPWALALLAPLAVLVAWAWRHRDDRPRVRFSSIALLEGARRTLRMRLLGLPTALLALACVLLVGALARPQAVLREIHDLTEGIDIMLVIDVSGSMRALDFEPNRLEKAKQVVKTFIAGRADDRIGLVVFAKDSFALTPLTQDYKALGDFVDRIDFNLVDGTRTAIGMGLANAVNQLRKSNAKSKVVILLTDGENNYGQIDPAAAAGVAKAFGVRVYTIGIGTVGGLVDIPIVDQNGQPVTDPRTGRTAIGQLRGDLDAKKLTEVAATTGGQFFHATDGKSLEKIYSQIDKMEKTRVETPETLVYDELAPWLIVPALALLLLAFALENSWLRTFP